MASDLIPIERLTTGVEIIVPDFGSAEVYGVEFDGVDYIVQYCTDDAAGWDALDTFTVPAGGSVEHAYKGEAPWYRDRAAITDMEWEALAEVMAKTAAPAVEPVSFLVAAE